MTFRIGDRVRTLAEMIPPKWEPGSSLIPAGCFGTVGMVNPGGCGVYIDGEMSGLMTPYINEEIEAA